MDELANSYQQPVQSMDDLAASYKSDAVPDSQSVPVSQYNDTVPNKVSPGFLKSLEMIGSGAAQGMLTFTGSLLSLAEKGLRGGGTPTTVPDAVQYWKDKNESDEKKYTGAGILQGAGQLPAEVLTTAPLGGPLGAVMKGAAKVGEVLPTGLKTLGKYGTSALGGAGVLAGMESQRYDPENPGQIANFDAAEEALKNPASYVMPMVGTKLSTWMDASRKLGEAKEVFPNIMARNLKEQGAGTTAANAIFGVPALFGFGKQVNQLKGINEDVTKFIQKISGTKGALTADNLTEYSANIMQSTLKKMERAEDKIWDKGFKSEYILTPKEVKDDVINAIDLLKTNKIPGYEAVVNSLDNGIRPGKMMRVEDVKKLQTIMSGAAINAKGLEGGIGNDLANSLSNIKDSLLNHIQGSLSPAAMKDFSAARAFSANKFELFKNAPMLYKAINDTTNAHKLINTLTSEGGVLPPKKAALGILSKGGQDMIGATKLQQALEAADPTHSGNLNLETFLAKTSDYTQNKFIQNKSSYEALQGLNKYLQNINEASQTGWRQVATGGAVASTAAAGMLGAGATGLAVPLAAYSAATFVANHSPLKTLLHAVTKKLPNSTYDLVTKNIEKHLTRAGFLVSQDGILKHKDEK